MCVVCGCADSGDKGVTMEGGAGHHHSHHGHAYMPAARRAKPARHEAAHVAVDASSGDLHFGAGAAKVSVPGMSQARAIRLETDILGENDRVAAQNREQFSAHGVTALNLVSSPGSGKTTLLCATIEALKTRAPGLRVAVIEGDQQTSFDADRIRATGAPALQINTGKGCHLDAPMVAEAFARLHRHDAGHGDSRSLLFIENVGNLVCPAMWDLGEAAKVAILSVTEGEDKPLKYPDMFAASTLMLVNKIDLLPYVNFDVERCIAFARRVNPAIEVIRVSATTGEGMGDWLAWMASRLTSDAVAGLRAGLDDIVRSVAS
ncbi:hydrogenase nickel incorporation protein HypB [Methyloversatilis sp.]|uniref:hydrogenase nickel incorporation protein HypB n=1 Tax=Methyloversatilis sp. TaxID=2569862 RepID=UPI00273750E6|nr:hydrogenase nickel incorporation protein HypB [Methyloversatilis sp.]MDP2869137.1 hydrogenase nickel incorporation protein HypB [Methyloversatilis sp.]MDP3457174.1 hydrogenase nickel incorporation protein HypB [Methyloversatilis sp.]MDP3579847.1 hydrogenase nickel incorporation protein HypB [Methyloversatilis sp.]